MRITLEIQGAVFLFISMCVILVSASEYSAGSCECIETLGLLALRPCLKMILQLHDRLVVGDAPGLPRYLGI